MEMVVSLPVDTASISLIFRKIPVMVRCIITGLERGEGFAQLWNFSNFLGKTRPLCMSTQKSSCENAAREKSIFRGAADEVENRSQVTSVVLYFVRVRISPYKPP